ncbi:MAG: ATP-binding protein [Myxococcaceae bacterium]|jgi:hypothetical protein|nr:ATP-binding protein [Myxococcaceae bacterium]
MNAADNPFAPGAGTPPPELAGRSGIIQDAEVAVARARRGLGKSMLLLGLRGVGKTVLLNRIGEHARQSGVFALSLEAPEGRGLAEMLVPELRRALLALSSSQQALAYARRGLAVLRGFAGAFKVKHGDVEVSVSAPGVADSGNLEHDLPEMLEAVVQAAQADQKAVVLLIDEVQYLTADDLSALIVATHKLGQKGLPFLLVGAGLPLLAGLAGNAKSYAERLFDFPNVGPLTETAASEAIEAPLAKAGITIETAALRHIVRTTKGYPFFLQEWGYQAWNAASSSPITEADVVLAGKAAIERLDAGFFKVRRDRLTPKELEYLNSMATLGPGPHKSSDVSTSLGKTVTATGPVRDGLIKKGMIYSPQHGLIAFTVPLFDEYLRRAAELRPG